MKYHLQQRFLTMYEAGITVPEFLTVRDFHRHATDVGGFRFLEIQLPQDMASYTVPISLPGTQNLVAISNVEAEVYPDSARATPGYQIPPVQPARLPGSSPSTGTSVNDERQGIILSNICARCRAKVLGCGEGRPCKGCKKNSFPCVPFNPFKEQAPQDDQTCLYCYVFEQQCDNTRPGCSQCQQNAVRYDYRKSKSKCHECSVQDKTCDRLKMGCSTCANDGNIGNCTY